MPRHHCIGLACLATAALLTAGCGEDGDRADEALSSVELADRQLMAREQTLLQRRGALQRERTQLRDKRAALLTRKMTLSDTDPGRAKLEREESRLATMEAGLVQQEITLNKKLQTLLSEKNGLVKKLSEESKGNARKVLVARREHSIALREKDLSRREATLARRERDIARREQALAVRQAKLCPDRVRTVEVVRAPRSSGSSDRSYTRKDVEPVYRAARKAMSARGILTADLPPGVDRLLRELRLAMSRREFTRARFAADQLLAMVRTMRIDRGFIGGKIGRLSQAIKRSPPKAGRRAEVDRLFREATAAYGDGRFSVANRKLNAIYGKLR